MQKLKSVPKIFKYILLFLAAFVLAVSFYICMTYDIDSFEQLLYTIRSAEGTGTDSIMGGIIIGVIATVIVFAILITPLLTEKLRTKVFVKIKIKKKKFEFPVSYITHKLMYAVIIFAVSVLVALNNLDFFNYMSRQMQVSTIYEDYYVNSNSVQITFPEKKQNLIHIYVESLEASNFTTANGGLQANSYTPKLEQYALENTSFSNGDKLGGAVTMTGTGWTTAAMIAQMMGINMKVDIYGNDYSGYSSFLGGATGIGDILKDNGYKNYFLMGSDATFGGRRELLEQHGDYEIFDLLTARREGKIPEDYKEWWGFEDTKLFEYAKEMLTDVSKKDEPFNFSLLTADTHFYDGYLEKGCPSIYGVQYANVFHCSDSMIYEFVEWVKTQSFADDTTIVITGDHLTMQSDFYDTNNGFQRTVYNAFINPRVEAKNEKNRQFSTLDYFPTTLAALGAKIEGDRLGLGTNLFSSKPTILEEMGYEKFDLELSRRSNYYNNNLLGDSYYEMQKTIKENPEAVTGQD